MAGLTDKIRDAVAAERFLIGLHAANRLEERAISEWHIVAGLAEAKLLSERPATKPNPSIVVSQLLPDGTPVTVVWSWLQSVQIAKLVTVHFNDNWAMKIPGKRIKIPRWVHAGPCVVRVEVEAVIPDADPSEPCLEPATVKWLDELRRLAEAGEVDELAKHGEVYVRRSA